jgi:hypothetical protein
MWMTCSIRFGIIEEGKAWITSLKVFCLWNVRRIVSLQLQKKPAVCVVVSELEVRIIDTEGWP